MKTTFASAAAVSGLFSLANAQYFSLTAARSASPIHLQPINAANESLWIGVGTASYCPYAADSGICPAGTTTAFAGPGEQGGLSMDVEVPGGQSVYIDPEDGAVKYTVAHSASEPEGAITNGWTLTEGSSFGELSYTDGVLFCSVSGTDSSVGPWQMFAVVPNKVYGTECLSADLLTSNTSSVAAWQYQ